MASQICCHRNRRDQKEKARPGIINDDLHNQLKSGDLAQIAAANLDLLKAHPNLSGAMSHPLESQDSDPGWREF